MRVKGILKKEFKSKLLDATMGCSIQHNGWTCGTCFFCISDDFNNQDWQSLLLYRGDYKKEELDNLPENPEESIKKIWEIIK